jgi:hypothetical protein
MDFPFRDGRKRRRGLEWLQTEPFHFFDDRLRFGLLALKDLPEHFAKHKLVAPGSSGPHLIVQTQFPQGHLGFFDLLLASASPAATAAS